MRHSVDSLSFYPDLILDINSRVDTLETLRRRLEHLKDKPKLLKQPNQTRSRLKTLKAQTSLAEGPNNPNLEILAAKTTAIHRTLRKEVVSGPFNEMTPTSMITYLHQRCSFMRHLVADSGWREHDPTLLQNLTKNPGHAEAGIKPHPLPSAEAGRRIFDN
jgi:nitrate/nitrite-specific signal transduction histidine kinase